MRAAASVVMPSAGMAVLNHRGNRAATRKALGARRIRCATTATPGVAPQ